MPEYLNLQSIQKAADLVNTTLLSRGYSTEKLLFSSIDWPQLIADQPEKDNLVLETQEIIYNNDKNIINIVYSLCQALDKSNAQNKTFNKTLADTQRELRESERKLAVFESKNGKLEQKLENTAHFEVKALKSQIRSLEKVQRTQTQDIQKLRSGNAELQVKYDVEMRKKAMEISNLKDKLLDTRQLSHTLTYGNPPLKREAPAEINTNIVHNMQAQAVPPAKAAGLEAFVTHEYEQIAAQLSDLIENLMSENSRYSKFIKEASGYFSQVNGQISPQALKNTEIAAIASPSEYIDVNGPIDANSEIEPFSDVSRPLLANIYTHYHHMQGLVEALSSNPAENDSLRTVQQLVQENKVLQANWKGAMDALDEWKQYNRAEAKRKKV